MPAHSRPGFTKAPPPRGPNSPRVPSFYRPRPSATPPLTGPRLRSALPTRKIVDLPSELRTQQMFPRAVSSGLTSLFRTPGLAAVTAMSTGTFVQLDPLNYRDGARVEPVDSSGTEKAFEPATGNRAGRGWSGLSWPCALGLLPLVLPSTPQRDAGLARPQCGAQSAAEARGTVGAGANEIYLKCLQQFLTNGW